MVRNIVKKGINAFNSRQTSIFLAAFFIILTTVFSQVLGFLKYRLLVSIFGASNDLGVFLASFRIPDFIFQVLIGGALSSAFIPVFSDYLSKDKKEEANSLTSSLVSIGLLTFVILSVFVGVFSYQLSSIIAPGFSHRELELMSGLTRILLFSQLFFILATMATAILQCYQHFLIPGVAASFYNLGIIIGLILLTPAFGIFGAAIGVFLGALLFFLVQIPYLKKVGYTFKISFDYKNGVMKVFHLMVPRSLTLLVSQFAITANVFFASFVSARSLVIYDLAQTLVVAPVILFGQSIAQASFPSLSLKKDNKEEFISIFISSFNQILYLILPMSALLIVLRIPIVRLFYGASRFDWQATVETGMTLAFFSISIAAFALTYLLSRAFFALKDAKTPFIITALSVLVNITFAYIFVLLNKEPIQIPFLSHPVTKINLLALSYSLGNIFCAVLLVYFLDKKIRFPRLNLLLGIFKMTIATLVMGVAIYVPIKLLDQLVFDTTKTINLIILTGISSSVGLITFVFFTWLLDIKEAYYVIKVVKRVGDWKKTLKQVGEPIDGSKISA